MKYNNPIRDVLRDGSIKISNDTKQKPSKKPITIEDLRYGVNTTDKEEIDLCLNCPYEKCVDKCARLRNYRKKKHEKR